MESISIDSLTSNLSRWKLSRMRDHLVTNHLDRSAPRASISIESSRYAPCLDDFYLDRISIPRQDVNRQGVDEDGVNERQCKQWNVVTSVNERLV